MEQDIRPTVRTHTQTFDIVPIVVVVPPRAKREHPLVLLAHFLDKRHEERIHDLAEAADCEAVSGR